MDVRKTVEESYNFWFGMNTIYEKWAKLNELNMNSLMILYVVQTTEHDISQKEIGEKLYLPKQTVNSTLNAMEKNGWVIRKVNKQDKREKDIFLTPLGVEKSNPILEELYNFEYKAFSQLSDEEREQFVSINSKLLETLWDQIQ